MSLVRRLQTVIKTSNIMISQHEFYITPNKTAVHYWDKCQLTVISPVLYRHKIRCCEDQQLENILKIKSPFSITWIHKAELISIGTLAYAVRPRI